MSALAKEAMRKLPANVQQAVGEVVSVCNFLRDLNTDEGRAMQLRLSRGLAFFIECAKDAAELSIPKYEHPVHWDGVVGVN